MKVEIRLFGVFRDFQAQPSITIDVPSNACVEQVREAVHAYGVEHWPAFKLGLLQRSVFGNEHEFLRKGDRVPSDGRMVLMPPVSGG